MENTESELPMIVWLRGDEDYLEDFTVDAEEAMAQLGIKRSRLTQISGKELRVGRIRRDRYVRPIYRLADIEKYQEQTRPTITHQRSARVIQGATQKLEDEVQSLQETAQNLVGMFADDLLIQLGKLRREISQNRRYTVDAVVNESATSSEKIAKLFGLLSKKVAIDREQLLRIDEKVEGTGARVETLKQLLTIIHSQMREMFHDVKKVRDQVGMQKPERDQAQILSEARFSETCHRFEYLNNLIGQLFELTRENDEKVQNLLKPSASKPSRISIRQLRTQNWIY